MQAETQGELTQLLAAIQAGCPDAQSQLLHLMYSRFYRMARHLLAEEPSGLSLQPSDLLDEAVVRILQSNLLHTAPNRVYLLRAVGRLMRRVLVEHARRRQAEKRGGKFRRLPLDALLDYYERQEIDTVALHDALEVLSSLHERAALAITWRTIGGCSEAEVAELLGVSVSTIQKDTQFARAWLRKQLADDDHEL